MNKTDNTKPIKVICKIVAYHRTPKVVKVRILETPKVEHQVIVVNVDHVKTF